MSASEPNLPEIPSRSRDELAVAPTEVFQPDEPSSQLATLLDGYLAELQSGRQPDRVKLLAEHPELAAQLERCLSGIEFIYLASAPATKSGMPTQLGDFRIVREVGRGGMGVVYEAEQVSLKRRVALKVLRFGAASDTEAMQRFQREAETVATLHHTNIVPIFAIGCEQGVNYYAMQFIEGRSLADATVGWVEHRETHHHAKPESVGLAMLDPPYNVANWGLQAAEALAHAHQRGVIHRDIKPSNLILDPDGRIWLTDFGLAKRMDDVSLSLAGTVLGTPRYMSPEQAAAAKQPVDHRTDIYSLGATLYELATGRPLFEADSPHAVITQILTKEPPAPRVVCPSLPRDFETIIVKCLAKEPERRYATAQALADDLRAFVEGRAIKARRATLAEQAARWFKQQKRSVGVAAAAVAATVFVVIGSVIAWQMHAQSLLGYLTLNTPRDGNERAEVAEVLTLDDEPVGSPFTLPTKEPLALPEGAYRLRLTAPSKVSQTYLFDVAAGQSATFDVGLVNETVGHAIAMKSPVGAEVVQSSPVAPRQESRTSADAVRANDAQQTKNVNSAPGSPVAERQGYIEPRLFVGPQDKEKPTMRCYLGSSQPGWKSDGSRETEVTPLWSADWRLEAPGIVSFLKLPEDREAWKVLPAQTDVFAWQQVLAWFVPSWHRNVTPTKIMQPARDLNGDGVEDVIWIAPRLIVPQPGAFFLGPLTPLSPCLVAASGKDGQPLWWFRPQDSKGAACRFGTDPVWSGDAIVCVVRSVNDSDSRIEAISPRTGESLWRHNAGAVGTAWLTTTTIDEKPSVIAIIQDRLFVLDSATGEPKLGTPAYLDWSEAGKIVVKPEDSTGLHKGNVLLADLRFADLDGDGVPEALLSVFVQDQRIDVVALSLARREALWQVESSVTVGPHDPFQGSLPWPFIADLDDDGQVEVVVPNHGGQRFQAWTGCRVLNGATGELRWQRRYPINRGSFNWNMPADRYIVGPDLDGDGLHELIVTSIRSEFRSRTVGSLAPYQHEEKCLYVDCFSGRDGSSVWWQRIPLGLTDWSAMTGTVGEILWWQSSRHAPRDEPSGTRDRALPGASESQTTKAHHAERDGYKLVIPVHRHPDTRADDGTHSIYVLSATTGRVEHHADDLAFPKLVDWNNDGLDDLAVFVPDDPVRFASQGYWPPPVSGKWIALRGSPPEAFRRLDRWAEEQDFDGDGIAELSRRDTGTGMDYAVQIASGRDGRIKSRWKVNWPETPNSFTVGNVHSFPPPLGDFDGDGLADLLITRDGQNMDFDRTPLLKTGQAPLLTQAISSKTGKRIWGGVPLTLPDWMRPTNADENSEDWLYRRFGRLLPVSTQAVDLDGDGRPELLQALRLIGHGHSKQPGGGPLSDHQQPFVALIDALAGTLRWFEPFSKLVPGDHAPGLDYLRIDASTDLNGDGTRDLVLTVPQQSPQGSWSLNLQVHNGRDGKVLWGPKPLEGENHNNNDFNSPIISDLDGDGRPEIVLMPKQPHVTVLRGDTGEQLWTWKGSQPLHFSPPGIAVVQSSPVAPRQESRTSRDVDRANDTETTTDANSAPGISSRGARGLRCVAVTFNETGSQWDIVLLDHAGKELEKVPCGSNQLWSHDLDGDGGEELIRQVDNKLVATRELHDVLWTWPVPPPMYGWVSRFDRTPDGRVIVVTASTDSVTLLDGPTGKPLGRTFKSTNTSLNENGRNVDLNHVNITRPFENSRLLTRAGDGQVMLNHVVSRAVLPTDDDGRYQRASQSSRHAPRDEPNISTELSAGLASVKSSSLDARSAHHAERDGYKDDPRLVRQLPWAPSQAEWAAGKAAMLQQAGLAILLAFVVWLIPFWLIRAGVRRRELGWWRAALIFSGLTVIAGSLALFRFASPGAIWRGAPWALPIAIGVAALPGLVWLATLTRNLVTGEWRRLSWLLGGTLLAALALAVLILSLTVSQKPLEQHYSWHAWWFILLFGAHAVGALLLVWKLVGPSVLWLWRRFRRSSGTLAAR